MSIPDRLAYLRIALVPAILTLILAADRIDHAFGYAAIVMWIASFTDFLDGYLARRWEITTVLGGFLDSIADTWGKAAAQRARILESLATWQACQLWLVKHASKTAIRKINPETKKPESISKHLKTEVPPGYQFDPREFDDTGKWTENKKLWEPTNWLLANAVG